jgi:glycosyltransferase involved in cell wall biosynthesis
MALGIPSISTDVNGIPEAIKHLKTGWLIETGDVGGLANAVEILKSDKTLREKLSENGRNFILQNFNEREVAKIAVAEYKKSFSPASNK